jgi:hypothetical protein
MVSWLAIFGGPTGPVPAFGKPAEPVVGGAGSLEFTPRFGTSATCAGGFACARRFAEFFGACTVIAGNVAEFVALRAATGAAPAGCVAATVCANDRCSNARTSITVKAALRNPSARDGTQILRPGRVRLKNTM